MCARGFKDYPKQTNFCFKNFPSFVTVSVGVPQQNETPVLRFTNAYLLS
jgi:hypothetical protein